MTALEKDRARFEELASNDSFANRILILQILQVPFHPSGKIGGAFSIDSTAGGCDFCQAMRKAAEMEPGAIICGSCYDCKQQAYRPGVAARHMLQMDILSHCVYSETELPAVRIPAFSTLRFLSSGDLPMGAAGVNFARNVIRLARINPTVKMAIWSKNVSVWQQACRLEGCQSWRDLPHNLQTVQSSPRIDQECKPSAFFRVRFTVYNSTSIDEVIAAGAGECNGRKCADCGWKCYTGAWEDGQNIAELKR